MKKKPRRSLANGSFCVEKVLHLPLTVQFRESSLNRNVKQKKNSDTFSCAQVSQTETRQTHGDKQQGAFRKRVYDRRFGSWSWCSRLLLTGNKKSIYVPLLSAWNTFMYIRHNYGKIHHFLYVLRWCTSWRLITGCSAHLQDSPARCPDEVATHSSLLLWVSVPCGSRRLLAKPVKVGYQFCSFWWILKDSTLYCSIGTTRFASQVCFTTCN